MPRITKRDKEFGKGKPKNDAPGKKRSSATGPPGAGKKSGFKVGPSHAPRDAYLGKAKKIKDDLIKRAKAKKNYAKVLKEEGMASNRLSAPGEKGKGRERVGLVKDPYAAFKNDVSDDGGSDDDEDEEQEQEAELMVAGRKRALSVSPPPEPVVEEKKEEPRRAKGKGKEVTNDRARIRPTPAKDGKAKDGRAKATEATTKSSSAPKSRSVQPAVIEPKRSMRDMKKEAFSKRHSANGGGRPIDGRTARGQPKMSARMDVLLEQIKRGKK